jgi:hypothetical protein
MGNGFQWLAGQCKGLELFTIPYLKNNLSVHGRVAKRFKMYCSSRFQRDSAFSPFHAPDSRAFAKLNLLFQNPNLIFEIGYRIWQQTFEAEERNKLNLL